MEKLNIYVVDDDVFYLKSVILGLNAEYSDSVIFKYFFSANELLLKLNAEEENADYILLDYNLNTSDRFNGMQLIKEIKKINSKTEIIVISAQNNEQIPLNAIKNGASSYIQKKPEILDSIRQVLNRAIQARRQEKKIAPAILLLLFLMTLSVFMIFFFGFMV
jgi:DNA-binding NtrC family response regulator